jgi:hypothetical protein
MRKDLAFNKDLRSVDVISTFDLEKYGTHLTTVRTQFNISLQFHNQR